MPNPVMILLPSGRVLEIDPSTARELADRLWTLGLEPGAMTTAVKIVEALRAPVMLDRPVELSDREFGALSTASDGRLSIQ